MASCKIISRLSSRLQPFTRNLTKTLPESELSQLKSSLLYSASAPVRRISGLSRLPVELGSMMPLHSAVASARLISSLSIDSHSWGLVPQGLFSNLSRPRQFKWLLVTNDEMRDHIFQLVGNDFFPRLKERHQVHFTFSEAGPVFHVLPPCSVVIQESEEGHWHIPVVSEHEREAE